MNIALIPARGGSKGIPNKNKRIMTGKPLVVWTIEAAQKAKCIDEICVSTDDDEIKYIAENCGVRVLDRPKELAGDNVHTIEIVKDFIENIYTLCEKYCNIDIVSLLQPTSPLRTAQDLDNAYATLQYYKGSSVVGVCKVDKSESSFRHMNGSLLQPIKEVGKYEEQRQDIKEQLYVVNGAVYMATINHLQSQSSFHRGPVIGYVMSKYHSVDVNDEDDWFISETLLRARHE